MAGEANQTEFEGAAFRANFERACGRSTVADGDWTRNGGIISPAKSRLTGTSIIYRFGSCAVAEEVDRVRAWWVLDTTFDLYAAQAPSPDSLASMVRQNLAVPETFSAVDRIFKASLLRPLLVFSGVGGLYAESDDEGRTVRPGGRTLPGGAELSGDPLDQARKYQFFIPGLGACNPPALLYHWTLPLGDWFRRGKPASSPACAAPDQAASRLLTFRRRSSPISRCFHSRPLPSARPSSLARR